jgi:hypothetical protein
LGRRGSRFTAVEMSLPPSEPVPPALVSTPVPAMRERSPDLPAGLIEILLPGSSSLRVGAQVDGPALRRGG